MELFWQGKFGKKCGAGGSESAFRKYQIDKIVKEHNKWRAKVAKGGERRGAPGPQPPASNMKALQWDDELAQAKDNLYSTDMMMKYCGSYYLYVPDC